jgi:hypothetical protein
LQYVRFTVVLRFRFAFCSASSLTPKENWSTKPFPFPILSGGSAGPGQRITLDDSVLGSPDYFAYYYSVGHQANLPPPLLSWEQYSYIRAEQTARMHGRREFFFFFLLFLVLLLLHFFFFALSSDCAVRETGDASADAVDPWGVPSLVDKIQTDFPATPSKVIPMAISSSDPALASAKPSRPRHEKQPRSNNARDRPEHGADGSTSSRQQPRGSGAQAFASSSGSSSFTSSSGSSGQAGPALGSLGQSPLTGSPGGGNAFAPYPHFGYHTNYSSSGTLLSLIGLFVLLEI